MTIDWMVFLQGLAVMWYAATALAIWRFCDALDGHYVGLRLLVTLLWPVVLPTCGVIFLLGYLGGSTPYNSTGWR